MSFAKFTSALRSNQSPIPCSSVPDGDGGSPSRAGFGRAAADGLSTIKEVVCGDCAPPSPTSVEFSDAPANRNGRRLRRKLQRLSLKVAADLDDTGKLRAFMKCNRYPIRSADGSPVRVGTYSLTPSGEVRTSGLHMCKNPWVCAWCAPYVALYRKAKVDALQAAARRLGFEIAMVTSTLSHDYGDRLKASLDILRDAQRAAHASDPMRAARKRDEFVGAVTFIEITHGRNGWHPHAHSVFFFNASVDRGNEILDAFVKHYSYAVERSGRVVDLQAQHRLWVRDDSRLSGYLSKESVSWEVSGGGLKQARGEKSRTFFDLIEPAAAGDPEARRLYREYLEAMQGVRSGIVHSSLRKRLGLTPEDLLPASDEPSGLQTVGRMLTRVMGETEATGVADEVEDAIKAGHPWYSVKALIYELLGYTPEEVFAVEEELRKYADADRQLDIELSSDDPAFKAYQRAPFRVPLKPGGVLADLCLS